MGTMTRTERLLRLARQRGDLLAVATLEERQRHDRIRRERHWRDWTEAELREAWGNR